MEFWVITITAITAIATLANAIVNAVGVWRSQNKEGNDKDKKAYKFGLIPTTIFNLILLGCLLYLYNDNMRLANFEVVSASQTEEVESQKKRIEKLQERIDEFELLAGRSVTAEQFLELYLMAHCNSLRNFSDQVERDYNWDDDPDAISEPLNAALKQFMIMSEDWTTDASTTLGGLLLHFSDTEDRSRIIEARKCCQKLYSDVVAPLRELTQIEVGDEVPSRPKKSKSLVGKKTAVVKEELLLNINTVIEDIESLIETYPR